MMSRRNIEDPGKRWLTALSAVVLAGALGAPILADRGTPGGDPQTTPRNRSGVVSTVPITPVEGPSTLHHLRLEIEGSSMGWAGQWSSPPSTIPAGAEGQGRSEPAGGPFVLTGADLYRIS
jgi:hypothetical protein